MSFQYGWFQYRQIKDLFNHDKNFGFRENIVDLENYWLGDGVKLISKIYKMLLKWYTEDEMVKDQMVRWAINFDKETDMSSWEYLWKTAIKISTSNNLKENCFKMLYSWYMTPTKLANMNDKMSKKCWKCKEKECSFYYMWWTCDKAKWFGTEIHLEIDKSFKM